MKSILALAVSLVLASAIACAPSTTQAQGSFWNTANAYLGQKRPHDEPIVFAPGMLADDGMVLMGRVAFSRDGKEFYYTQDDSWDSLDHAKIMMVRFRGGHWESPAVVAKEFISPTLSIDGDTLYMRHANMHNVWQSRRVGESWGAPTLLLDKPYGLYDFMPTTSGTFYVGSDPGPEDKQNGSTLVFSTLKFDNDSVSIESLGRPLNKPGFNGDLYVAPDESYMILSTNETKTFESELYVSFREVDGKWSAPVSLGEKINNGLAHRWGQFVTPDGKYLFYSRGTNVKDCAIYWVRFDGLLRSIRRRVIGRK